MGAGSLSRFRPWARISLLFTLAGLLASRMGLLVHEFVGHGGSAWLFGGTVTHWRLFLFGGGWIQYERAPWYSLAEQQVIALAGVSLQALVAALLWWRSRRVLRRASSGAATPGAALQARLFGIVARLLWAHGCLYILFGTHYGFGDGRLLHEALSAPARLLVLGPLALALTYSSYGLAREAMLLAADLELGYRAQRIVRAGLAIVVAASLHYGLFWVEAQTVDPDQTYAAIMEQELSRKLAAHMARLARLQEEQGQVWEAQQQELERASYIRSHKPFPLRPMVYLACALAAILGALRFASAPASGSPGWNRQTAWAAALRLFLLLCAIATINALG